MHRIDTAGNVAGLFANPDPVHGQIPVVVDAAYLNDLQENVMALLAAASIAPVKGDFTQVLKAIKFLVEGAWYADDTGAANAYVIAPAVAITAYSEGQTFRFKALHANTGPSTIAVNGLPAKNIVRADGSALVAADILASEESEVVCDGANFQLAQRSATATTTSAGEVALATDVLAQAMSDTSHALVPSNLAALFSQSLSTPGYVKLPGGGIIQFLTTTSHSENDGPISYSWPISWVTGVLGMGAITINPGAVITNDNVGPNLVSSSTSSFSILTQCYDTASPASSLQHLIIAIGK